MATKRIKDLTNTATSSTLDANQYAVVDGSTGTFKTKLSELATWIHGRWASFVNGLTAKTSFASGDKIAVVNGSTATAMDKDDLLKETAQNALAGNVAQAFDATRDNTNPYKAGESVVYKGETYTFRVDHYGAWSDADVYKSIVDEQIKKIDGSFETEESTNKCDPSKIVVGMLNSSGEVNTSYTNRRTSDFILVEGVYVSAYSTDGFSKNNSSRICFYDSSKNFISYVSNPSDPYQIPATAVFVRVSFSDTFSYFMVGFSSTNNSVAYSDYFYKFVLKESSLPTSNQSHILTLKKFFECDFVGGNVHLSIDDVGYALYSLKTQNPPSLWDNAFFAQLKNLHDTYGICITCNCFNFLVSEPLYDIATIPSTWSTEFVAAKNWLKFAFHGKNENSNYSTDTTLVTDYNYFVGAVYSFTGDYECIDGGTRLSYFGGTKSQISDVMSLEHGIKMLWTRENSTASYYLSNKETTLISGRGKYIDFENKNMVFVRSMPRLDNHTIDDIKIELENVCLGKLVELYCHENLSGAIASSTITRINNALSWFKENGYSSNFLTIIYK